MRSTLTHRQFLCVVALMKLSETTGWIRSLIEAQNLTKDYGDKRAVDGLTFRVEPGVVTGFLGPNGSGKSTTMRLILGLDRPTAGTVTVNGKLYRDHAAPLHEVGALPEGRTVFVSSHLMSEMALTADHLIVIGRGRLIADLSVDEFVRKASKNIVRVRSPQASALRDLVVGPDVVVETVEPGVLEIVGLSAEQIGDAAAERGFAIHELTPQHASLEEAFMDLTREDVEYRAGQAASEPEVVA